MLTYDKVLRDLKRIKDSEMFEHLVWLYNSLIDEGYTEKFSSNEEMNDMEEIDNLVTDIGAYDFMKILYEAFDMSTFNPDDDWYWFNKDDTLCSCDAIYFANAPFTIESLAKTIIDNNIEDYQKRTGFVDFEENYKRRNRRKISK